MSSPIPLKQFLSSDSELAQKLKHKTTNTQLEFRLKLRTSNSTLLAQAEVIRNDLKLELQPEQHRLFTVVYGLLCKERKAMRELADELECDNQFAYGLMHLRTTEQKEKDVEHYYFNADGKVTGKRFCATCLHTKVKDKCQLFRCGACYSPHVRYCSRECQKQDWKQHKVFCASLQSHPEYQAQLKTRLAKMALEELLEPAKE